MKYNLCSACVYYIPSITNRTAVYPAYCSCPDLDNYFSLRRKGFIAGTDIIHCDYFQQHPLNCGDVRVLFDSVGSIGMSYIICAKTGRNVRCPELYDNVRDIKTIYSLTNKN